MDVSFTTFATLSFLLFAATSGAPAGLQDPCADVKSSSLSLNQIAKMVSVEARKGLTGEATFNTSLIWMEAKDMCDPETLKQKSMACTGKMLTVLTRYIALLKRISEFQSCSALASQVMPEIERLHNDMAKCVKTTGGWSEEMPNESKDEVGNWEEPLLCHYTLDRLFSFSILAARVFAVGDPAGHADGSAQKCM